MDGFSMKTNTLKTPLLVSLAILLSLSQFSVAEDKTTREQNNTPLEEVIVSGQQFKDKTKIDAETERLFSVAGAGLDPLASLQSLPGVSVEGGFGGSEPAVRGSAPEDNAYYIDAIPARYIFHIFGNSIFSKGLIHEFNLHPGAFGNLYTNATGAVIDVSLRDPKQEPMRVTANWSMIISGILVESQLAENQAFYASYRRSLIDKFLNKDDLEDEDEGIAVDRLPTSEDYQFKYRWDINDEHAINVIAAGARDRIGATFSQNFNAVARDPDFAGPAKLLQKFNSQGLIWDWDLGHLNHPSQLKTIISLSKEFDDLSYGTGQLIKIDKSRRFLKSQLTTELNSKNILTSGASFEASTYDLNLKAKYNPCSELNPSQCEDTTDAPVLEFNGEVRINTLTAYLQNEWQINPKWYLTYGFHASRDNYLDESAVEPRAKLEYLPNTQWQFSLATGQYSRTPNLDEITPVFGNPELKNLKSKHIVFGAKQFLADGWSWSSDLYYKKNTNVTIALDPKLDTDFAKNYTNDGEGEAYGLEFLLDKQMTDNWYGWVALSLSRSERTDLRRDRTQLFSYDRPVILHFVGNYLLSERWTLGFKWTFQSGSLYTPVTELVASDKFPDVKKPVYGEPFSERLPLYHRLDIRAEYKAKLRKERYWSVFVDLLNAYNQNNVKGYDIAYNGIDAINETPDGFGADVPVSEDSDIEFFPSIGFEIHW